MQAQRMTTWPKLAQISFLDAVLGFQKTAALKAALALDLFTAVAQESGDLDRIAARTGAAVRGIRMLCDYLTVQGFLTKSQGRYGLTPSTEVFLTTTSPAWMGSIVEFMASPEMISLWLDDPVSYVRNGGAVGLGSIAPDHPGLGQVRQSHGAVHAPSRTGRGASGPRLADAAETRARRRGRPWPVRDHAGSGDPRRRRSRLWTGQQCFEVAQENAKAAGVMDRYRTIPGSAFEVDWGSGYDLVLLDQLPAPLRSGDLCRPAGAGAKEPERGRAGACGGVRAQRGSGLAALSGDVLLHDARVHAERGCLHGS